VCGFKVRVQGVKDSRVRGLEREEWLKAQGELNDSGNKCRGRQGVTPTTYRKT